MGAHPCSSPGSPSRTGTRELDQSPPFHVPWDLLIFFPAELCLAVPAGLTLQSPCLLPACSLPEELCQTHAHLSRCVKAEWTHACQMWPCTPPSHQVHRSGGETWVLPLAPCIAHPPWGSLHVLVQISGPAKRRKGATAERLERGGLGAGE